MYWITAKMNVCDLHNIEQIVHGVASSDNALNTLR